MTVAFAGLIIGMTAHAGMACWALPEGADTTWLVAGGVACLLVLAGGLWGCVGGRLSASGRGSR